MKHVDRIAFSLLKESFADNFEAECGSWLSERFDPRERANLAVLLERGISSPKCSSMGRLFDGIAAIAGVCHEAHYDAQPAMMLEFALGQSGCFEAGTYQLDILPAEDHETLLLDWAPLVRAVFRDSRNGLSKALISAKFHRALADASLALCECVLEKPEYRQRVKQVVLSGGCFQNKYLTEFLISCLQRAGFSVYHQCRIPPNDNGISIGQLYAAVRQSAQESRGL